MILKLQCINDTSAELVSAELTKWKLTNVRLGSAVVIRYEPVEHNVVMNICADWGYYVGLTEWDEGQL